MDRIKRICYLIYRPLYTEKSVHILHILVFRKKQNTILNICLRILLNIRKVCIVCNLVFSRNVSLRKGNLPRIILCRLCLTNNRFLLAHPLSQLIRNFSHMGMSVSVVFQKSQSQIVDPDCN